MDIMDILSRAKQIGDRVVGRHEGDLHVGRDAVSKIDGVTFVGGDAVTRIDGDLFVGGKKDVSQALNSSHCD